jgi:hypothetical protein
MSKDNASDLSEDGIAQRGSLRYAAPRSLPPDQGTDRQDRTCASTARESSPEETSGGEKRRVTLLATKRDGITVGEPIEGVTRLECPMSVQAVKPFPARGEAPHGRPVKSVAPPVARFKGAKALARISQSIGASGLRISDKLFCDNDLR